MTDRIVNHNVKTDYAEVTRCLLALSRRYDGLQLCSIGRSTLEQELWVVRLGEGDTKAIYVGAHHGKEWITSYILLRFIEDFYGGGLRDVYGYDPALLRRKYSISVIPLLNPDGVDLQIHGLSESNPYYSELIFQNNGSADFSDWQANIRGVDLNHNYDAGFELCKRLEHDYGIFNGAPTRFGGERAESEPESRALAEFTRQLDPAKVLALHSQGREIYYDYNGKAPKDSKFIGLQMARLCGYKLTAPEEDIASHGGYKDWFIDAFDRPGYTIEVGEGVNPLPLADFPGVYAELKKLMTIFPIL